ncbi:MAG: hypothetical protein ABIE84_04105 [bacterium]
MKIRSYLLVIGLLIVVFLLFACSQTTGTSAPQVAATLTVTGVNPYTIDQPAVASSIVANSLFPADAQMNVTFSSIKFSEDGVSYGSNILSEPITINLFDSSIRTDSGSTVEVSVATGIVVTHVKMAISAMSLSASGETTRNIKTDMEEGGEFDLDGVVMEVLPFSYSGGELRMNMFMPRPTDVAFADWNPRDSEPTFNFYGDGIVQSAIGTLHINVVDAVPGNYLYAQAYRSREQGTGPVFTTAFTEAAATAEGTTEVTASGSIVLPAGTFYLAVSATNGPLSAEAISSFESTEWTIGGKNRSNSIITVEAYGEHTVTLSRETDTGSSEPEAEIIRPILQFLVTAESTITLGEGAGWLLFSSTTESGILDSIERDVPFMETIEASSFLTTTLTIETMEQGTYYLLLFLDVDGDRLMDPGLDYWGTFGGNVMAPDPIVLTNEVTTIIDSENELELMLFTDGP